jgi:hypothetical protein
MVTDYTYDGWQLRDGVSVIGLEFQAELQYLHEYETPLFCLARFFFPKGREIPSWFVDPYRSSDPYSFFGLDWFAFQVCGNCKRIAFDRSLNDHRHCPQERTPCSNLPFSQPSNSAQILENSKRGMLVSPSQA